MAISNIITYIIHYDLVFAHVAVPSLNIIVSFTEKSHIAANPDGLEKCNNKV